MDAMRRVAPRHLDMVFVFSFCSSGSVGKVIINEPTIWGWFRAFIMTFGHGNSLSTKKMGCNWHLDVPEMGMHGHQLINREKHMLPFLSVANLFRYAVEGSSTSTSIVIYRISKMFQASPVTPTGLTTACSCTDCHFRHDQHTNH